MNLETPEPGAPPPEQTHSENSGVQDAVAPGPDLTQAKLFVRELAETALLAILIFLAIQAVVRNFRVEGSSMQPTIQDGEYLIVNRLAYSTGFPVTLLRNTIGRADAGGRLLDHFFHPPQRGDIIVFIPPSNPQRDFIKRVIGLPGDTVEIRQGRVYINGQALTEPYIRRGPATSWGPVVVPQDEVFVLGDNRGASTDSRSFGMLEQSKIVGRVWLCYWPPARWSILRHYDLAAELK